MGKKQKSALDGACRADVFAEGRQRNVAQTVSNGDNKNEKYQNGVFEIGKNAGNGAFLYFRGFDLVNQLLNQTERTQSAADHSAEENAV